MNDTNKNENEKHYREQQSHHHHHNTTTSSSSSFSLLCCQSLDTTTIITNMMPSSSSSTITNNNTGSNTDTSPPNKKSNKMENDPTTNNHHNGNHSSNNGFMGRLFHNANRTIHHLTTKKYALPDKIVASQILMYRQLLHTSCRNHLILSRPYEATPAQISVQHMPWWETTTVIVNVNPTDDGDDMTTTTPTTTPTTITQTTTKLITMVDTGKMVISYENLIQRLWNAGLAPYYDNDNNDSSNSDMNNTTTTDNDITTTDTTIKPSFVIPHSIWVSTLGFQQTDPVTDFRSGGILSLALMVWIVEHCPTTYSKFIPHKNRNSNSMYPTHPASVLPFGITSINITDMLAKLLMLSKKFDRMDALMSQTPFWPLFHDPYAILTLQELSCELLCGVVEEIVTLRQVEEEIRQQGNSNNTTSNTPIDPINTTYTGTSLDILSGLDDDNNNNDSTNPTTTTMMMNEINNTNTTAPSSSTKDDNEYSKYISVFDFTQILSMTEERVEYDLLGSGPRTIDELRYAIYTQTLLPKYQQQLQQKIHKLRHQTKKEMSTTTTTTTVAASGHNTASSEPMSESTLPPPQQPQQLHEKVLHHATHGIGHLFSSVSSHHNSLWKNGMNHILSSHNKSKEKSNDNHDPTQPVPAPTTVTPTVVVDLFDTDVVNHTADNINHNHDMNDDWMNQQQFENTHDRPTSNESNGHNNNTILYDDMFDAVDLNDRPTTANGTTTNHPNDSTDTTSTSMFCITDD